MFAMKLSGTAFNLDCSPSYFKGFDDIPIQLDASDGLFDGLLVILTSSVDIVAAAKKNRTALIPPASHGLIRK